MSRSTTAGRFVAAGPAFDKDDGTGAIALARFNPDSFPDESFDGDGYRFVNPQIVPDVVIRAVAIDSVGRIVVGGTSSGPSLSFYARRFLEHGGSDCRIRNHE